MSGKLTLHELQKKTVEELIKYIVGEVGYNELLHLIKNELKNELLHLDEVKTN
jgi:hypothetical protein